MVSGPSGSGKSSILSRLREHVPFQFSVSATTRHPRPGEVDGVDYKFLDTDDFETLILSGELLEWAIYNKNYYGTPSRAVDEALAEGRNILLDIEIQGARQVRKARPGALMIFIEPPSMEELERRLRSRGDTSESDIRDRMAIVASQMDEAAELFDYKVVNEDLDVATAEVANLIINNT